MRKRQCREDLHHYRSLWSWLLSPSPPATADPEQGPRPEDFSYEPLEFTPPNPDDFRTELSNGLVVYIAEDHEIPWFDASLMVRTGPFLEPADKIGVAGSDHPDSCGRGDRPP